MKLQAALIAMLVSLPTSASACQFYAPTTVQLIAESQNLVLSYPVAISNLPRDANDRSYRGEFRQTILWEVAVSWKGKLEPGDRFTTRRTLDRSNMCSPRAGIYSNAPILLAFGGREPYRDFDEYSAELHEELFRGVQRVLVRKASN